MSEKMLRIPLSDLKTIRVVCKQCNKGVVEIVIGKAHVALDKGQCRLCGREVVVNGGDPLDALSRVFEDLERLKDKLGIEFEIQAP